MTQRRPPPQDGMSNFGCFVLTVGAILLLWFWWYFIFIPYIR